MLLRYKKLNENAIETTRGSEYAAGLDLYATADYTIYAGEAVKVSTGIAAEIPPGYFGAVYARSGLATKEGLRPANCVGVIDADYRGEIIVAIHNDSLPIGYYPTEKTIHKGDRIAQLVIQPCMPVVLQEVEELTDTPRGEGGFGSTGKSSIPANTNTGFDYEQITLNEIINKG